MQDQGKPSAISRTDGVAHVSAAEYVRMSTDHQKYSTENQSAAIRKFAAANGMEVVRTYADAGKSGLNIEGRDALKQLIDDVQSGRADFEFVLVYDVSRWGRFQDADESGYYEYICKRAGITQQSPQLARVAFIGGGESQQECVLADAFEPVGIE